MRTGPSILVFCDLDDTVLEPHTLSVDASTHGALDRLESERLGLVFCSSKTRAELELIQQALGISQPFICEDGAALVIPRGYFGPCAPQSIEVAGYEVVEFGRPYSEVVGVLRRTAGRLETAVVGFNEMSVEDVASDCGLPLLQARLAKLREYSEPFRTIDGKRGARERLLKGLHSAGLTWITRGRYDHVSANHRDTAYVFLHGLYRRTFGEVVSVAFGDHAGAVPLLRHVDIPLVVQSRAAGETTTLLAKVPAARLSLADSLAPWADAVLRVVAAIQHGGASCPL